MVFSNLIRREKYSLSQILIKHVFPRLMFLAFKVIATRLYHEYSMRIAMNRTDKNVFESQWKKSTRFSRQTDRQNLKIHSSRNLLQKN
jgi:hypothetical protein